MQRHEGDRVGHGVVKIQVGDQRHMLEEEIEVGEGIAITLVQFHDLLGLEVPGRRDQFHDVLGPLAALGPLGTQPRLEVEFLDQLLQDFARGQEASPFTMPADQPNELRQPATGPRGKPRNPLPLPRRLEQVDARFTREDRKPAQRGLADARGADS